MECPILLFLLIVSSSFWQEYHLGSDLYFYFIASVCIIIAGAQCGHQLQAVSASLSTVKVALPALHPYPEPGRHKLLWIIEKVVVLGIRFGSEWLHRLSSHCPCLLESTVFNGFISSYLVRYQCPYFLLLHV